jgi:hypothetical protein
MIISCQKHRNINARHVMPLTTNLQADILDVWRIDFIGPFPKSKGFECIMVAVDYDSN